jgi:CheY-like chemotaxis protein
MHLATITRALRGSPAPPRRGDRVAVLPAEDPADYRDNRSRHVLPKPGLFVPAGAVLEPGEVCADFRQRVMAKRVLVVVDDEDARLRALRLEMESRYGAHYQVVSSSSAEMALARLAELKTARADVPLVLADQHLSGISGTQLLARVRQFFPTARGGFDPLGRAVDARQTQGTSEPPETPGRFTQRDQWGFIFTGPDTGQDWPLQRAPFLLETTTPGVFAAGDVRHGAIKRLASAVGEAQPPSASSTTTWHSRPSPAKVMSLG